MIITSYTSWLVKALGYSWKSPSKYYCIYNILKLLHNRSAFSADYNYLYMSETTTGSVWSVWSWWYHQYHNGSAPRLMRTTTRICASQGCAWSLKPIGYPVRYSGQFEFLNFHICQFKGAVNPYNVIENVWNQNHFIKHFFTSFWKKMCLKLTYCLEVISIASLQIFRISQKI